MNRNLLILFLCFGLTSCALFKGAHKTQQKYLPKAYRTLYLGMPKAEALSKIPQAERVNQNYDFREVYMEEPADGGPIESTVFYFDAEGEQVLYEFIFNYTSEEARDAEAQALFGAPNHEGKEWLVDSGEGFLINAWTFQQKLVIAGKIAGTEWEDE